MCTKNQAIDILHEVYHACADEFYSIQDAYLYGSYARGDYTSESDVDILLTVTCSAEEIARHRVTVATISSDLSLKHGVTVSVSVKSAEQFRRYAGVLPYYQNVVKEGIRYVV